VKKYILVLMAVLFLGLPGVVRASNVDVPNPASRWFGVSWAFERVSHNIQVLLARTDEKKVELELVFAEKEVKLAEKIVELEETNPELAEKLGEVAEKLEIKHDERLEKIDERIVKWQEREEKMGGKLEGKIEQIRERKEVMEVKTETLEGDGVKIQNAKPGVVRMR